MRVVTSFSLPGYREYGERFLETYRKHWKDPITVYSEDDLPIPHKKLDSPDHLKFLAESPPDPENYRLQARKFSYKTFAILDAAQQRGKMLWLDADVVTHRDIPKGFVESLLPKGMYTAYLGRENMHSECGFVIYDCNHPIHDRFMREWRDLYSGGLFKLPEWHDSFVFDYLRKKLQVPGVSLSGSFGNTFHPFINSQLGKYMDHLKGNRKGMKRSPDLDWRRPEAYWR